MTTSQPQERNQYLSFSLGGSDYAVGILQVKEILQFDSITRVPSVPTSVRGVINLRGSVVPVVDLSVKFGQGESPVSRRTCVLVVEVTLDGQPAVMGVLADGVTEVVELGKDDIEPPPHFGGGVRVPYLTGMGKVGQAFILLIDLDQVLAAEEKRLALHPPTLPAPQPRPAAEDPAGAGAGA
ncbi:MAG TPA: chemotaxis protein CheW [Anaeromyxobacteraceae bacterium]|nr:chemotaxis protein CheW [Anaeromyxobacteraceae bacterium]